MCSPPHPCISFVRYDNRLLSHARAARRAIALPPEPCAKTGASAADEAEDASGGVAGDWPRAAGVVPVVVAHSANTQSSAEEADAVCALVDELVGRARLIVDDDEATAASADGVGRVLTADDVLVVAPFNQQVRTLRAALEDDGDDGRSMGCDDDSDVDLALRRIRRSSPRVGTVDAFQGQEAPVVIVSLTLSADAATGSDEGNAGGSGTDPDAAANGGGGGGGGGGGSARALAFVLNRNRLNVALSRAQCVAFVVGSSEQLADAPVTTLRGMREVNSLCRLLELPSSPELTRVAARAAAAAGATTSAVVDRYRHDDADGAGHDGGNEAPTAPAASPAGVLWPGDSRDEANDDGADDVVAAAAAELEAQFKLAELKKACRTAGLRVSGRKAELARRLAEHRR